MSLIQVTDAPLDLTAHLAAVADPTCGAQVTFVGQIRDHDPGADGVVTGIDYSSHPDAEEILRRLVGELLATCEAPARVAVSHRIGRLAVGDLALVACVATAHRSDAYDLSRALVERIKAELPVWKKQYTADGDAHWVGL